MSLDMFNITTQKGREVDALKAMKVIWSVIDLHKFMVNEFNFICAFKDEMDRLENYLKEKENEEDDE